MTTLETQLYHIHYRIGQRTGKFNGKFDEAHKDIWLAYLNRPENSAGVEYWAEPVVTPEEDRRAYILSGDEGPETARRLTNNK